jgi:uncharacterized protein YehS (DUF1456 family)
MTFVRNIVSVEITSEDVSIYEKRDDEEMYITLGNLGTNSFIHSFIIHSINPYKADKPIGYRICHDTNCIRTR